jgi:hypothetical protein
MALHLDTWLLPADLAVRWSRLGTAVAVAVAIAMAEASVLAEHTEQHAGQNKELALGSIAAAIDEAECELLCPCPVAASARRGMADHFHGKHRPQLRSPALRQGGLPLALQVHPRHQPPELECWLAQLELPWLQLYLLEWQLRLPRAILQSDHHQQSSADHWQPLASDVVLRPHRSGTGSSIS